MVQRDSNAEPSEMNHREPVVCSTAYAVACQLMRVRPAGRRTLRDYFGTFCAQPCILASICSHFAKAASAREIEKPYISQG